MGRLLIVDDEEDVREFAANFFRRRKVDTITAASGEEALQMLENGKVDLILLDINMAGMSGIETLKFIKAKTPGVKVIMVTGTKPDEGASFEQCKELGAIDYIHKPLELEELENIVMGQLKEKK